MKEYDTPMFTAHRSIGKSSENLLGFASEVFFGFSILLLALNIGIYQTGKIGIPWVASATKNWNFIKVCCY